MHAGTRIPLIFLLFVALQPAAAEPVYSWVDPAGITHFSGLPPPPGVDEAMQLDLPPYPAAAIPADDYYSVINQAARMESRRLEREKLEAQRRLAEAEAQRARAEALAAREAAMQPAPAVSYPYLPWYPVSGRHPHRHHPRRDHRDSHYPHRANHPHHPPDLRHHRYSPADFRLKRPPAMTVSGRH